MGPIQTCDTCIVEVDGKLVRACATAVEKNMEASTTAASAHTARSEAFNRILRNHQLYCTVCDNSNGKCTVHNTTKLVTGAVSIFQDISELNRVQQDRELTAGA